MRTNNMMKAACLMLMASATTSAFAQKMNIEHKGDTTIIKVENPTKYLLLPIQEEKDEAQVLLDTGSKDDTWMDVRLAQNGSDYYVPFFVVLCPDWNVVAFPIWFHPGKLKL
jgi:fructan beta-fructosidase